MDPFEADTRCESCGGPVPGTWARFCPSCGAPIEGHVGAAPVPEPAPPDVVVEQPPRWVSPFLSVSVLFGGVTSFVGWILLLAGAPFVMIFVGQADFSMLTPGVFGARASGEVLAVEPTGMTVNESRIYRVRFAWVDGNGEARENASYTTGATPEPGAAVAVEYTETDPTQARIAGMSHAPWPCWVAFVALFPLLGLAFVVSGIRRGLRAIRLFRDGLVARGVLRGKTPTNTIINNRPVYALTFAFRTEDGMEAEVTTRTHEPERLEDEGSELILYDPETPSLAMTLDDLPGSPRIDEDGRFAPRSHVRSLMTLILPGLTVLAYGLWILSRFL